MPETLISDLNRADVFSSLKEGQFELILGAFSARLASQSPELVDFLFDVYRDVPANLELQEVTDIALNVRPPNVFRKYLRPQVIPDPGFKVPAVPLPKKMAPLSLEMGMNLSVALKCCRFLTFHAGAVANENGGVLISGASGSGKSTLTTALMQEGYRLFSDEFGLLSLDKAEINPYPRPVSLKGNSISVVRDMVGAEWVSKSIMNTPKGEIAYRRARRSDIEQANVPAPVKLILFPSFAENISPRAKKLTKAETIMRLIESATNYKLLGEAAYKALTDMVVGAEAYDITYGDTEECMQMVRDFAGEAGL
ncbi:HprK-related kinase A [Kordiimonas laminariae]|uniref:HprK-related kinase A n=1 Tax=Kordiimonas laminariae TaxID=2917717 RepID=UPI001FF5E388|nr:HprK-related kinase A [Kordiimonas laminariae]MCK0070426.1 HprK-related kinase A [Kordiimonas laminariae]